ncbi:unnamed protein product [Calypogeia fissa]
MSSEDCSAFEKAMKDEFQFEDVDRITQATFLDWVNDRNKALKGPQKLLREFNRKLSQLPAQEAKVIELQRCTLFLRSASEALREELENALDLLDPKRLDLSSDWNQLEKAVMKVSNRHRRRELDKEAMFERVTPLEVKPKVKVEPKVEASFGMDGLSDMMKNLTILTAQLVEQKSQPQAVAAPDYKGQSPTQSWPSEEPELNSIEFKKRLADRVCKETGWDVLVLISSIIVEVGAAWDARVDEKQKDGETKSEPRRKDKRRRDEFGRKDEARPSTPAPAPAPPPAPPDEPMKEDKPVKKTPGWILGLIRQCFQR